MNNQPDDIRKWIQDLIARSASDQLDSLKRFDEMLRKATRGEINQSRMRDEYLSYAREEGLRYVNDLTRVGLSFYNTLLELNRHYNERFFEQVFSDPRSNPAQAPKSEPRVVPMDVHAPLGEVASHAFVIENHRPEAVQVSFLVSEFSSEDPQGGEVQETRYIRPPLQLVPPRFTLRSGEERRVEVRIHLSPEIFTPGDLYTGTVVASGFEELQLRLRLWADPARVASIEITPTPTPANNGQPSKKAAPKPKSSQPADDLSRIKGIGPLYQKKLIEGGVRTFASLADASDETLAALLDANAVDRARRQLWREQARLAVGGDWASLENLQPESRPRIQA